MGSFFLYPFSLLWKPQKIGIELERGCGCDWLCIMTISQASNVPRFCVRPCLQWPTRLKGLARLTCFLCFPLQLKSMEIH